MTYPIFVQTNTALAKHKNVQCQTCPVTFLTASDKRFNCDTCVYYRNQLRLAKIQDRKEKEAKAKKKKQQWLKKNHYYIYP